jgi:type IV pilus assembly protein PilB
MAKSNVDQILAELGNGNDARTPAPRRKQRALHRADRSAASFSPLPAVPAHQRGYGEEPVSPAGDPAVKTPPPEPRASVGPGLADIYTPGKHPDETPAAARLGEALLSRSCVTPAQLTAAQQVIRQSPGKSLVETLLEQGIEEEPIQRVVADLAGLAFERIDLGDGIDKALDGKLLQRLGIDFCKQHLVLPLRMEGARAVIGATTPDNVFLLDEIRQRIGVASVKLVLVTAYDVRGALEIVGGPAEQDVDLSAMLADVDEADVEVEREDDDQVDLEREAAESPVIRYVNYIIQTAIKEGASDIHIEPSEHRLKVRFRIDGVLFEMMNPPAKWAAAITSRIKIMANLDISERRIPQDGRIRCTVQGRKLDLRVSTIPTAGGEKTVLRILDTRAISVQLEDLGFSEATLDVWRKVIDSPHGIVLVTGPTGSGKTTTLYASLRQLDKNSMNISTVEDPIEYHLDGITQTQTHEKIGMGFATALRALLRQDPDVIMLGEVRDHDTATIAIQAAMTGHLVLSTLHTNDAPSSITRLINIGIEPFLVGAAVNAVLAQRLIRRLCTHCRQQQTPTPEMAEFLAMRGLDPSVCWGAPGCDRCRSTGYSGRTGIYELLTIDDQVRDIIARNPNVAEFRRLCLERGMVSLRQDGMRKVASGVTIIEEVLRATEATV